MIFWWLVRQIIKIIPEDFGGIIIATVQVVNANIYDLV